MTETKENIGQSVGGDASVPVRAFVRKTQKTAILMGLGIGTALALLWSPMIGYGFIAGVALSIVNFQLMAADAFEVIGKSPKNARSFVIGRYVVRYAIIFGFLALMASRTELSIPAAFIGLFFVQICLFAGQVFRATGISDRFFKGLR